MLDNQEILIVDPDYNNLIPDLAPEKPDIEMSVIADLLKYSPDQERDERGRFASGSSTENHPTGNFSQLPTLSTTVSQKETTNLAAYIGVGYYGLNSALRSNQELGTGLPEMKSAMDSLMDKVPPLEQSETVYRGVSGDIATKLVDAPIGTIITDKGYVSTSRDKELAQDFMTVGNSDNQTRALMAITLPEGTKALDVSKFYLNNPNMSLEKELILPRGSQFQIIGRDGNTVQLKAIL